MKKSLTKIITLTFFLFIFLSSLAQTQAQTTTPGLNYSLPDFKGIGGVITSFNSNILQNLVLALSGAAVVVFFFGLVRFIFHRAQGNDAGLKKDKEGMLWGLGALFVLVSVWGIIQLVQSTLGVEGDENIHIPKICFTDNCASPSSQSPYTSPNGLGSGDALNINCASGAIYSTTTGKCVPDTSKLNNNYNSAYNYMTILNWNPLPVYKSSGDNVAQLQNFLKGQGYNNLEVNGSYDLNTQNAVKDFQTKMKLIATGDINHATQAVIVYRVLNTPPATNEEIISWTRDLDRYVNNDGTNYNNDVRQLQKILNQDSCYLANTDNDEDNKFGPDTEKAVKNYQSHNDLLQDGIVGPSTRAVLGSRLTNTCQ